MTPGHIDGTRPADIKFGGLAAGTKYNFTTYQCTNIYCHGNGQAGSTGSASWVGTLSGGCGACHDTDAKNLSGKHDKHVIDKKLACSECHSCVVDATNKVTNQANHVNGKKDVCGMPGSYSTTKTCNFTCHGDEHKTETW